MIRRRLACALLALSVAGCGTPVYVTTEPRSAEIWVDGRFVGFGAATVPTNGVVFNSYRVEARSQKGDVLAADEVNVHFGPRSAVMAGVGLLGILVWPLLPLIPASFFAGEPDPDHLHLRVPAEEPAPPPAPRPDEMDRPVIDFAEPAQGEQVATSAQIDVKGRARHWSGVASVEVLLDGKSVQTFRPARAEPELAFAATLTIDAAGSHVIAVKARGVRGAEAAEEVRITRIVEKP